VLFNQLVRPFEFQEDEILQSSEDFAPNLAVHHVDRVTFSNRRAMDCQELESPSLESLAESSLIVVWYFASFALSDLERSSKYIT
jgi:hypothetical protein